MKGLLAGRRVLPRSLEASSRRVRSALIALQDVIVDRYTALIEGIPTALPGFSLRRQPCSMADFVFVSNMRKVRSR
jgi:hypothetical protein